MAFVGAGACVRPGAATPQSALVFSGSGWPRRRQRSRSAHIEPDAVRFQAAAPARHQFSKLVTFGCRSQQAASSSSIGPGHLVVRAHDDDDDDYEPIDPESSRARRDDEGQFESEFEELLHYITRGTNPSLGVRAKSEFIPDVLEDVEAFLKEHKKTRKLRVFRMLVFFWHDAIEDAAEEAEFLLNKKETLVPRWMQIMVNRREGNVDAAVEQISEHGDYAEAISHALSASVYDFLMASRDSSEFGTRFAAKTLLKEAFQGESLDMGALYQAASRAEGALDEDPFYELLLEIQMLEFETLLEFAYFNIGA